MVIRTRGGDHEVRAHHFESTWNAYLAGRTFLAPASGEPVTVENATALPAVLNAIRLIAETTGRLPIRVYSGRQAERRERDDTWQWDLLNRMPNPDRSAFDFWQDVATCIETRGDAFALKAKSRRRVEALFLLHPDAVTVRRSTETGELLYVYQGREFSRRHVLHIRGLALDGGDRGMTPLANQAISSAIARYKHEGSIYRNGGSTPYALKFEDRMNRKQAGEALAVWKSTTAGIENTGNPGILSGGASLERLGLTLEDAQFIESHEFSVKDIARLYNLPASLLNGAMTQPTEEESRRFMNFGLAGRLDRIVQAVAIDPDIFPDPVLYPEFFIEEFVAANALTTAQIRHLKIQDGSLLIDEARAEDGRDPLKPPPPDRPGLIPQVTPVGGAPNPVAVQANQPEGD